MPKGLGLFYVALLTVPLYIKWDQFIIAQFILPTPYHQPISIYVGFQKVVSEPLEHCDLPDSSIQFLKASPSSI